MSSTESLIVALQDAATIVDWPEPSPDWEPAPVDQLTESPPAGARHSYRWVAVAAAIALVFAAMTIPPARQAIASLLERAGITIEWGDPPPINVDELGLGSPTSLDEAARAFQGVLRTPSGGLGPPEQVFMLDTGVVMTWPGDEALPAAADSGIGVLFEQRPSPNAPGGAKVLTEEVTVTQLSLEGGPALWIEGTPHTLTLLDRSGSESATATRLAANVLLWESDSVAYRLETTADLATALRFVAVLQPVAQP